MRWFEIALLTVLAAMLGCPASAEDAATPYNVIVLLADDLGAPELRCYGNLEHETPRLDRLAREGMRFRTCWATPVCTPTRVMLLTGRYAWRTGWYDLIGRPHTPWEDSPLFDLAKAQPTFAQRLQEAGYATCLVGKWQLPGRVPDLVHECGFDEVLMWAYKHNLPEGVVHTGAWQSRKEKIPSRFWQPGLLENGVYRPTEEDDYGPDLFADFAIDFMRRHRGEPFLVYYPMVLTHKPWVATPDPEKPGERRKKGLESNVAYLDQVVGRIVDAVQSLGLTRRTVILFTGDNGTAGKGKSQVTEAGVHVPLIVRCPGLVPAGRVSDALVSLVDVHPTLLALAGVAPSETYALDGESLLPTLEGEDDVHRTWIYSYLRTKEIVRDDRWILDGEGRLWDTGGDREGRRAPEDVTKSTSPEARTARKRLEARLIQIPELSVVKDELRLKKRNARPPR